MNTEFLKAIGEGRFYFTHDGVKYTVQEYARDQLEKRSKWQAPVKGLEWQKIDTWYARCEVLNRDFSISEEDGKAWVTFGGFFTAWPSVEVAKQQVDAWRADMIRSTLEYLD